MGSVEIATVQHVTKKSSDELLSKFADDESGDEQEEAQPRKLDLQVIVKRRKRTRRSLGREGSESPQNCSAKLGERNSLLPPVSRRSALLRRIGISRSQLIRARGIKNRSILGTLEKTWRRTIEGASKVFVEKHHHKRLISDIA